MKKTSLIFLASFVFGLILVSATYADWTDLGDELYTTDEYVGIGTDSPEYDLHVVSNTNKTGSFLFEGYNGAWGEMDVFTISDTDTIANHQDESSLFKVFNQGSIMDEADGTSLVELTSDYSLPAYDDRQFYILGRAGEDTDEKEVSWGISLTDSDFWTKGDIHGGATGTDCGETGEACFNSPTYQLSASGDSYINGGNLGVGTSSPTEKLDVAGNAKFGSSNTIDLDEDSARGRIRLFESASRSKELRIVNANGYGSIGMISNEPFIIKTNNTERLRVDNSGNVGIGTDSPDVTLDVEGEIDLNDNSLWLSNSGNKRIYTSGSEVRYYMAGSQNHFYDDVSIDGWLETDGNISSNSGNFAVENGHDLILKGRTGGSGRALVDYTDTLYLNYDNDFSNGVYTPGNLTSGGQICDTNGCIGDDVAGGGSGISGSGSSGYLSKWNSSTVLTNSVIYDDGSNVGIGTSSPTSKLNVDGKITVSQDDNRWAVYATSDTAQDDEGAIYGEANTTSGYNTVGIWGVTNASGNADAGGQPIGVRGDATDNSPSQGQYGVLGYNRATNQNSGYQGAGVWGGSVGVPGSEGEYDGRGHGVQGETYSNYNVSAGGIFYALHSSGEADAIAGYQYSSDSDAYAIYGSGGTASSGIKSAIVYSESQGPTRYYVEESTEIYFSDYGQTQLENGYAKIELDPLFLETVTINEDNPLLVFTEAHGDVQLYSKPGQNYIEIFKNGGTDDNATFSYKVMAKRKFYENQRLDTTSVVIDKFMRPDLNEDELKSLNEKWGLDYSIIENHLPDQSPAPSKD